MSDFALGFLTGLIGFAVVFAVITFTRRAATREPQPVAFKPKPQRKLFKGHRP